MLREGRAREVNRLVKRCRSHCANWRMAAGCGIAETERRANRLSSKPRALSEMHMSSVAYCGFSKHCACWEAATAGRTAVYVNRNRFGTESNVFRCRWRWWYRKYALEDTVLEGLEKEARDAKQGLWAIRHPSHRGSTGKRDETFSGVRPRVVWPWIRPSDLLSETPLIVNIDLQEF